MRRSKHRASMKSEEKDRNKNVVKKRDKEIPLN